MNDLKGTCILLMCPIFTSAYRQQVRKYLTESFYSWFQSQTTMPPHVLEFVIKSFHFQHIFIAFLSIIMLPFEVYARIFWASACLFCVFIYLDGCILSNIEYKLCSNKKEFINIIDPFLYLIKKTPNTDNRYYYTMFLAVFYFIGCLVKYGVYLELQNSKE